MTTSIAGAEMEWAEINGAALRYAVSGTGPRTFLLIHELAGSLNSWDGLVPLLPRGLRVVRYDMRGAGQSEKVAGSLDLDVMADDAASLLDHLGIAGPVAVAGAAVGAAIATRFATQHPDRCGRLVLVAPALGVPAERREAALALCDRIDAEGLRPVAEAVLPKAFPEALWASPADKARAIARWFGADPQGYAAAYRMLVRADLGPDLARVRAPVLALAGRLDPFGTPEIVERLTAPIPDRRFAMLEGGHFLAVQSPAVLAAALAEFLPG